VTLREWLAGRTPPVPEGFASWMSPERADGPATVEVLAHEAEQALELAADSTGRPRGGAFDLLRADGFLTYACECALEGDDPAARLSELVRRFGT
jgi:hypothetical protein